MSPAELVLPMFVAETDFALAPAITAVLAEAVASGDTGYTPPDPGIRTAFAGFAARRFGWVVDPVRVRTTADVMMGVVEILRATTERDGALAARLLREHIMWFYGFVPDATGPAE